MTAVDQVSARVRNQVGQLSLTHGWHNLVPGVHDHCGRYVDRFKPGARIESTDVVAGLHDCQPIVQQDVACNPIVDRAAALALHDSHRGTHTQ